jgi:hypothetical protein
LDGLVGAANASKALEAEIVLRLGKKAQQGCDKNNIIEKINETTVYVGIFAVFAVCSL